ncbi:Bax inhibitor-1/YccA family protein [Actinophytocola oryzae]|uniref:Putative YccA/Bax inhibitor family protein n=1 Tax=Actinophytocola oryzae TaxID=502181 RepID=A0A4R7V981_9PSEU|nr:Bax inhibitor-1/YccA family protein [Actinophytocola oryzae]TDV45486.1 putative YccA/Bax inhibitor family protein [Actinophytocola oryzae]
MRSTSNPAFRNLPRGGLGGGYAGFQTQPQADVPGYGGYNQAPPTASERPMTVDDVVTKTALTLGLALVIGIITAFAVLTETISPFPPMIIGMIVGLVLSLIVIFKQKPSAGLVLGYSAAEGLFLGALTGVFEYLVPGIALQAILGTALVFIVMLVVYKTGAVKVTPKLTKWIIGATIAAGALMLINLITSFFGLNPLRGGGTMSIVFSIIVIGIAAFNFLLDFDMADQMIRSGMPSKWAWYAAFGLMTTLVWLYLEILRLLYYLNSD